MVYVYFNGTYVGIVGKCCRFALFERASGHAIVIIKHCINTLLARGSALTRLFVLSRISAAALRLYNTTAGRGAAGMCCSSGPVGKAKALRMKDEFDIRFLMPNSKVNA